MDFNEAVKARRSVRDYDASREVTDGQLKELFGLVKLSPSSYNLQPWEFIVVRDRENKRRLKACAQNQQHVEDASAVVIALALTNPVKNAALVSADRIKKGLMSEAKKKKFDAAVKRLVSDKLHARRWAERSTALACMTLMLAAQNMGLATCPMEGFDAQCVRREFRVPEEYEILMLVTLGYGSEDKPRPMRFGFGDTVYFEEFGKK